MAVWHTYLSHSTSDGISIFHNHPRNRPSTWKHRIWKRLGFLRYKILQTSDGIFPNSAYTKSLLREMGLPMATTHIVNPAVDPKAFYPTQKPNDLIKKYGVKDHKVILSVSSACTT